MEKSKFTQIVLFISGLIAIAVAGMIQISPVDSLIGAGVIEILVGLFCLFCLWKYRDS